MLQTGHTALHWACHNEELVVIEVLLREGADPNIKDDVSGRDICRMLVEE